MTDIDTDPTAEEGWDFDTDETPVEETKPTRTRAQAQVAPKAKDDDDDDDVVPSPRVNIQRGWGAAERVAQDRQHWIDRTGPGQRSFTCIADDPRGCPLCDAGHRASARYAFNVAVLEEGLDPVINSFEVGARVFSQLKNYHNDKRTGPLSKNYWAISKSGRGSTSATNTNMVRERDLPEDWRLAPVTEDEVAVMVKKMYGPEIIQVNSFKDLEKIAKEDLDD